METFGKAKKSGTPRPALKVAPPNKKKPNFMRENFHSSLGKSPQSPMTKKRLSK